MVYNSLILGLLPDFYTQTEVFLYFTFSCHWPKFGMCLFFIVMAFIKIKVYYNDKYCSAINRTLKTKIYRIKPSVSWRSSKKYLWCSPKEFRSKLVRQCSSKCLWRSPKEFRSKVVRQCSSIYNIFWSILYAAEVAIVKREKMSLFKLSISNVFTNWSFPSRRCYSKFLNRALVIIFFTANYSILQQSI